VELFVRKNTTKIKISVSQRISIKNCMNYDHNKNVGIFKFQSGYRKLYLNSPKGYSRKIINAQTAPKPKINIYTKFISIVLVPLGMLNNIQKI